MAMHEIIGTDKINSICDLHVLTEEFSRAFSQSSRLSAMTPPRIMIHREEPYSVFGIMASVDFSKDLFVSKLATLVVPSSQESSFSPLRKTINALVPAYSTRTGELQALFDGAAVTDLKCAAIVAVVTGHCACPASTKLGVFGNGALAFQQVRGVLSVRTIESMTVFCREASKGESFCERIQAELAFDGQYRAETEWPNDLSDFDIICTATTSSEPLVRDAAFADHVRINCMGSHTVESRELDLREFSNPYLIVENKDTAINEAGDIHCTAIEIEEMLNANNKEMQSGLTIFSSVGDAYLDLLTVEHLISRF